MSGKQTPLTQCATTRKRIHDRRYRTQSGRHGEIKSAFNGTIIRDPAAFVKRFTAIGPDFRRNSGPIARPPTGGRRTAARREPKRIVPQATAVAGSVAAASSPAPRPRRRLRAARSASKSAVSPPAKPEKQYRYCTPGHSVAPDLHTVQGALAVNLFETVVFFHRTSPRARQCAFSSISFLSLPSRAS